MGTGFLQARHGVECRALRWVKQAERSMGMIALAFVYGLVFGLLVTGGAAWFGMDRLARERDRYRRLFLQATGEIGKQRRRR